MTPRAIQWLASQRDARITHAIQWLASQRDARIAHAIQWLASQRDARITHAIQWLASQRDARITHAIQWLASQRDARITHAIILTDSMNLLQKVESGMGCPDWHTAMHSLRLQRLLWIYCPGHAGVSGNERADRLASTADITSGLQLGRAEVLRGLRNFLSTDKPEHHSTDRLKERGVEKGSGRHSTLQGRERSVFNQTNTGTVSRATLGRLLRDGAERVWAFPSATMPS